MSDNKNRDELAHLLFVTDNSNASDVEAEWRAAGGQQLIYIYDMADALIAAGYRKPRIVTTVEELDALTTSAAILDNSESVWVNDGDAEDPWASLAESPQGGPIWTGSLYIPLPATVLHEGSQP